eukprot:CAMPEP_0173138460 /NCGR_PEP_ID=MMETSP1105-20130129/3703_1 /TAXON_ID=2985 /ORGANISM="Ochromonas sp., Strain BG-1" /LENGTH=33 /DNA_ID= /DNA_START= /DNA_END= /DNA_ORIENTATION=
MEETFVRGTLGAADEKFEGRIVGANVGRIVEGR